MPINIISPSTGGGGATTLDALTDVTIVTPATGEILQYNGSQWIDTANTLNNLTDVDDSAKSTGKVLTYSGSQWEAQNAPSGETPIKIFTRTFTNVFADNSAYVNTGTQTVTMSDFDPSLNLESVDAYVVVNKTIFRIENASDPSLYFQARIQSKSAYQVFMKLNQFVYDVNSIVQSGTFNFATMPQTVKITLTHSANSLTRCIDVDTTGVSHLDLLAYDSVSQKWKKKSESEVGILARYPPTRSTTALTWDGNTVTRSSSVSTEAYFAFDGVTTTRWSCVAGSFDITTGIIVSNGRGVTGVLNPCEWLKIQLPTAILAERMVIACNETALQRHPKSFGIYGSNDNTTWTILLDRLDGGANTGLQPTGASYPLTFNFTHSQTYNYYMICINRVGDAVNGTNRQYAVIAEWELYQRQDNIRLGQNTDVFIAGQTTNHYLKYDLTNTRWTNSTIALNTNLSDVTLTAPALQQTLIHDGTVWRNMPTGGVVNAYPTMFSTNSNTWNSNTASGTTFNTGNDYYFAFDDIGTTWWQSGASLYNSTSGAYTGAQSVTSSSVAYLGERVSITIPESINPWSITVDCVNATNASVRFPRNFVVIASSNAGATWTTICSSYSVASGSSLTFANFPVTIFVDSINSFTNFYNQFQIVVQTIGPNDSVLNANRTVAVISTFSINSRETRSSIGHLRNLRISGATNNQALLWDSANLRIKNTSLLLNTHINDVTITSVADKQILMYSTSASNKWVNTTPTLNNLADVYYASPSDGQVLTWVQASLKWYAVTPANNPNIGLWEAYTSSDPNPGELWYISSTQFKFNVTDLAGVDHYVSQCTKVTINIQNNYGYYYYAYKTTNITGYSISAQKVLLTFGSLGTWWTDTLSIPSKVKLVFE